MWGGPQGRKWRRELVVSFLSDWGGCADWQLSVTQHRKLLNVYLILFPPWVARTLKYLKYCGWRL